jgi:hypothetical protein
MTTEFKVGDRVAPKEDINKPGTITEINITNDIFVKFDNGDNYVYQTAELIKIASPQKEHKKTLLDEFAMAALPALIIDSKEADLTISEICDDAYRYGECMMQEKLKRELK